MKKYINALLSVIAPLAAVPTGWAIYAGVTGQPAFPMEPLAAGVGAVAIIVVDIAASLLITDAYQFRQSARNQTERGQVQPAWWSWAILFTAVAAEIVLSLLIVVFPNLLAFGVLAFPVMTLAGVFAVAARSDLQTRIAEREKMREKSKRSAKPASAPAKDTAKSAKGWPRKCEHCSELLQKPQSVGGHMKAKHPELTLKKAYSVSFEPVRDERKGGER